ncbi:MAG: dihydrofolate reductase [Chitinophagaceae bacterium]|nr:dihydrofolate reductase [Chitinophagaceae bacterium]
MQESNNLSGGVANSPSGDGGVVVSLIVAASSNNAIGRNNQLLWHLPIDLKFFKNTTWAMPVIMGRKTFESVNNKPLLGRQNIIISRNAQPSTDGKVWWANSLEQAIEQSATLDCNEIFIVGGAQIYEQSMSIAHRIYMTRVHAHFEADTFFPEIKVGEWDMIKSNDFPVDEKHAYSFSIQVWEKKK